MSASSEAIPVETLRWRGARLELIDQRALPARLEYVSCTNAAEVAEAIRSMVVRGAPAIGCAAAFGIALEARRQHDRPLREFETAMEAAFKTLAASRPTAVNLFWALERMRGVLAAKHDPKSAAAELAEAALALFGADVDTNPLAVLPQRHRIPFYVAAPLSTIDPKTANGMAIPIEERSPVEVTGYAGVRWAPEGVEVANPAFDITPAALVGALFTEKGVVKQPNTAKIQRLFKG